ncbi:MAG TPA: prepilin-type N-terminal cleavage/methylation domain-containing protein [Syntrophales bacterium]|nr:prepilin-type N-terminal cleavage/methylation domain-containing protein [Syntrophales bacterium]
MSRTTSGSKPTRRNSGFTLLEIIVVLGLISLILGLSAFFFVGNLPSARLDTLGREMAASLRQARALAKTSGEKKIFFADLDAGRFGIEGLGERGVPQGVSLRIIDPDAVEFTRGKYRITFQPDGRGGGETIILSGGRQTVQVAVNPAAGAVILR